MRRCRRARRGARRSCGVDTQRRRASLAHWPSGARCGVRAPPMRNAPPQVAAQLRRGVSQRLVGPWRGLPRAEAAAVLRATKRESAACSATAGRTERMRACEGNAMQVQRTRSVMNLSPLLAAASATATAPRRTIAEFGVRPVIHLDGSALLSGAAAATHAAGGARRATTRGAERSGVAERSCTLRRATRGAAGAGREAAARGATRATHAGAKVALRACMLDGRALRSVRPSLHRSAQRKIVSRSASVAARSRRCVPARLSCAARGEPQHGGRHGRAGGRDCCWRGEAVSGRALPAGRRQDRDAAVR